MAETVTTDTLLGGRYRLLRQVAAGGMAAVWEGEDSVLGRRVAVKVLHSHLAVDDAVRERFRREAIAVARLSHPSVVAIYDTGEDDGVAYLVMELVEGKTLRDLLREEGRLAVGFAVDIAAAVAAGLAVAHERGIIHRDVKPGNILVDPDGRARITDFGIARGKAGTDLDEDLTSTGTIVGTAKYLAPEQVTGGVIDARTDVYALGLVLYEAVCGRPAFEGDTDLATAIARTSGAPLPVRQVRGDVPRELEAVIMRALELDPDHRFQTAADLRAALLAVAPLATDHTPPVGITYPLPSDRRFTIGVVGVVGIAVMVALLGFFFAATETGRSVLQGVRDRLPGGEPEPVAIVGAADFDPEPAGDGNEHPDKVALAHDGNLDTAWDTDDYRSPEFGRLKDGVGLRIDLAESVGVREVSVVAADIPWDAEIYVGDGTASTLAEWGEPVATRTGLGEQATFTLDRTEGRSVLIWITHLPPSGQLAIAEVDVSA